MLRKDKKSTNSLDIANLMKEYFCSVFLQRCNSALDAHDNPLILFNILQLSVVQVETSHASASITCLTNDNLATFVLSNCRKIIAPHVVQLFVYVLNTQNWPTFRKCAYNTHVKNNQSKKC